MPDYQPIPDQRAQWLVEWMDKNGLELRNTVDQTTRISLSSGRGSALDLMITNPAMQETHILEEWQIIDRLNGGSDHYATTFSIGHPGKEILDLGGSGLRWKSAEREKSTKTLLEEKEKALENFDRLFDPITQCDPGSKDHIDEMIEFITNLLTRTANRAVKVKRTSKYANPWWDSKCAEALEEMRQAHREALEQRQLTDIPDESVEYLA
jgi:hypothetical protein